MIDGIGFLEYIICFVEVLYMDIFFSLILKRKKGVPKYMYVILDLIMAALIFSASRYIESSSIVAFGLTIIYAIVLHSNKLTNKIFYGIVFILSIGIADIITANIVAGILNIDFNQVIMISSSYRFISNCISKLVLFIFLKFIIKFGNESDTDIDNEHIYKVIIIYMILIFNMIILLKLNTITNNRSASMLISVVVVGLLVSSVIIYIIFQNVCIYYKEVRTRELIELKNKFLQEYSISKETSDNEIRRMWHDLNNHIMTISSLAKKNDNSKIIEYIQEIEEYVEDIPITISTGNDIANAVLNQKKVIARNNNIKFVVQALIPEKIRISDIDLCAFLSNAIDNAIEANLRVKDIDHRIIKIKIEKYRDYLFINIINNVADGHKINTMKLTTTKKDKNKHGLGIVSMESIVKKYDGNIKYEVKDDMFELRTFLLTE